ncbi:MAG: SLBB domain-containing protein [Desulfohalobiaceae bacterium]|nr:SLBB domain-containing protein [Desulfohalobiaceae bacterium]
MLGAVLLLGLSVQAEAAGYWLVVSSCKKESSANDVVKQLNSLGQQAAIQNIRQDGVLWHRVSMGPFGTKQKALQKKALLEKNGLRDSFLLADSSAKQETDSSRKKKTQAGQVPADERNQRYGLLLRSFKKENSAIQFVQSDLQAFLEQGVKVFIEKVRMDVSGTWYRVGFGPYAERQKAMQVKKRMLDEGRIDDLVLVKTRASGSLDMSKAHPKDNTLGTGKQPEVSPQAGRKSSPAEAAKKETQSLTLRWNPAEAPNLAGYKIYYDTKPGPPFDPPEEDLLQEGDSPLVVDKETTRIALHGLTQGKEYYFAITAYDDAGRESDFSNLISSRDIVAESSQTDQKQKQTTPIGTGEIAPGDVLRITVPGQKEMSKVYDVDPEGRIYLLTIGELEVLGLSLDGLRELLQDQLKNLMNKGAKVLVDMKARKRYVKIQGGVRYPGWYRLPQTTNLQEIIFLTDGLLPNVDTSSITITHRWQGPEETVPLPLDQSFELKPNDIIDIPIPPGYKRKIDPGDLLYIRLPQRQAPGRAIDTTDVADLKRDLGRTRITVDKNGYIHLPNYGHIHVNGKTPEQVRQSIHEMLPRYLQELKMVQVSIVEKQHFVQVLGHVSSPGNYNVLEQANIQEVVDTAGGAVDGANLSLVKIMRQRGDEKHTVMVNLYQYTITGDIRLLPPLQAKDTLFVPISASFGNIKRTLDAWDPPEEKLEEDAGSKVRIFGAIHNPGVYEIKKDDMNVMDLMVLASGETDDADLSKVLIIRNEKIEESYNFEEFLNGEEVSAIPTLQSGDTVYIKYVEKKSFEPKEDKVFFISGKVRSPGKYKLTDDMTIFQALAMAGGMDTWADGDKILILRRTKGKQRNIPYSYEKAIAGKYPEHNIIVRPNDTIHVP